MTGLIFDEQSLIDEHVYKYDKFLHNRINKYTGAGRIIIKYWSINDTNTSTSMGFNTHYQILGNDSPLRYDEIDNMCLLGFSPLQPEEKQASTSTARNYGLGGEAFVIPGTIMPKENDFFIVKHINMNHLFRVTQVTQDGLNTDGSYRINYELFSTNPLEIEKLYKQTIGHYIMDLQTIGGEDLTPVISVEDHELRSRLIKMVNDMIENYVSRYYDNTHNCFILHLNGRTLFDVCGNMFMSKHGVMINDDTNGNIVLNPNKIRDQRLDFLYQKSPYKWIERDAPQRYLDSFKYHTVKGFNYPDSSFAMYGYDVDIMIPVDPWCDSPSCEKFFPDEALFVFDNEADIRTCKYADCRCCPKVKDCPRHYKCQRFDYVSIIHDFIYGKLTSIHNLSLYTGDQLFDNADAQEIYLWSPIIIYIIKQVLKIK
jgi:hypothetical protein